MLCRMGTHVNGPSLLTGQESMTLKEWLGKHPSALGSEVLGRFGEDLPFLFKVVGVALDLAGPHLSSCISQHIGLKMYSICRSCP